MLYNVGSVVIFQRAAESCDVLAPLCCHGSSDSDEASLVAADRLWHHAATPPPGHTPLPVKLGVATKPFLTHAVIVALVIESSVVRFTLVLSQVTTGTWQTVEVMVTRLYSISICSYISTAEVLTPPLIFLPG